MRVAPLIIDFSSLPLVLHSHRHTPLHFLMSVIKRVGVPMYARGCHSIMADRPHRSASRGASSSTSVSPSMPLQGTPLGKAVFAAFVSNHNEAVNRFGDEAFHNVRAGQYSPPSKSKERTTSSSVDHSASNVVARASEGVNSNAHTSGHRWNQQKQEILSQREATAHRRTQIELSAAIRKMQRCLGRAPDANASDYELQYQTFLLQLQGIMSILCDRHFQVANPHQLITLLRGATASGSFRLGFVVASSLHQLRRRKNELTGKQLIGVLSIVLTMEEEHGVPSSNRAQIAGILGDALRSHDAELLDIIHPSSVCKLVYALLPDRHSSGGRDSQQRNHSSAKDALLPESFCESFLAAVLRRAVVQPVAEDSRVLLHHSLILSHLVCVACAIAHFRVTSKDAFQFLSAAAPRLREGVFELDAHQLSLILLAFARVGYRSPEWFTAVGQRAGDLGERMSEDDAARVLQAFGMVGIEHDTLRRSLESSMRMKTLRRAAIFNKVF